MLKTLSQNLIYAKRIIDVNDGYVVLTRNDEDLDKIFQGNCLKEIKKYDFTPILPSELRAKTTVLIFSVDDIYSDMEKYTEHELINKNEWITEGIENIFKFPKNNMLKISFNQTASGKKSNGERIARFQHEYPAPTQLNRKSTSISTHA